MPIEMDKQASVRVYMCAYAGNWNVGMDGCAGEGGRGEVNVDVEYKFATMLPCLQKKTEKRCVQTIRMIDGQAL